MNSSFTNNLAERNALFQKIVDFLKENPYIKEMEMGQLEKITDAPKDRLEPVLRAMQHKAGLGRYVLGRANRTDGRKGPNRFVFEYKPEDIVNASLDADHVADPRPKNKPGRPRKAPVVNDAGKVVPTTNTRERHLSVKVEGDDIEIHISKGMKIDSESLKAVIQMLQ